MSWRNFLNYWLTESLAYYVQCNPWAGGSELHEGKKLSKQARGPCQPLPSSYDFIAYLVHAPSDWWICCEICPSFLGSYCILTVVTAICHDIAHFILKLSSWSFDWVSVDLFVFKREKNTIVQSLNIIWQADSRIILFRNVSFPWIQLEWQFCLFWILDLK